MLDFAKGPLSYALEARWTATLKGVVNPASETVLDDILWYYTRARHYHGLSHIIACFSVLDQYFPTETTQALEFAIWFHDYIYDTKRANNEAASAIAADTHLELMGIPKEIIEEVHSLILMTKHTAIPTSLTEKILIDVDLSILGEDSKVFDCYEQDIRKEYHWVPEQAFKEGRRKILQSFLDRPRIYLTDPMQAAGYEVRARANLTRSIQALED